LWHFGGLASINNRSTVAFEDFNNLSDVGIFSSSRGTLSLIADNNGVFSGFGGAASINAAGTVAFFAGFRAEGAAIFAGGIAALPSINDRGHSSVLGDAQCN
jgi:hypothetical protein